MEDYQTPKLGEQFKDGMCKEKCTRVNSKGSLIYSCSVSASQPMFHLPENCPVRSQKAWCDEEIFVPSIRLLMKLNDQETPHQKAAHVQEAMQQAFLALSIATPDQTMFDVAKSADNQQFVFKYLLVNVAKIFNEAGQNPRLYSQLLFMLTFDVPMREQAVFSCSQDQQFFGMTGLARHKKIVGSYKNSSSKQYVSMMFNFITDKLIEKGGHD